MRSRAGGLGEVSCPATHELVWSPGFSRSRPPEGAQPAKAATPNTARFMVTIHARKRVWAFHEPPVRCPPFRVSETQGHAKAWTPNSAVQVYGPNARPKLDVEAFHELVWSPGFSRSRPPEENNRLKPGLQTRRGSGL